MTDAISRPQARTIDERPRLPGVPIQLKERRKGSRINRLAPRTSGLQVVGLLGTILTVSIAALVVVAALHLAIPISVTATATVTGMLAFSLFLLALGSVEQRLIEIRLELMMLNGGARRGDRQGDAK